MVVKYEDSVIKTEINYMKKLIALAVATLASQVVATFGGEPMVSSKQVIAPLPPPPPEFFRPNEFDIGAFGSYARGVGSSENGGRLHGWGGGMDFTYWFGWKYLGARFQGAGYNVTTNNGQQTREVTLIPGFTPTRTITAGGGSVAAGVINADIMLRLPLDDFWPGVHLAPYAFGGFGGIFAGSGGESHTLSQTFTITNDTTGETRTVTLTGRRANQLQSKFANSRVLGRVGGGLEYRITPHIGLFTEAAYVFPDGSGNNFWQWNFAGLRYAF